MGYIPSYFVLNSIFIYNQLNLVIVVTNDLISLVGKKK